MKAFPFDRHIVESYARFSKSFSKIKAADLREAIEQEYEEGRFWPDALLALNPRYEAGPTACTATGFLGHTFALRGCGARAAPCARITRNTRVRETRILSRIRSRAWTLRWPSPWNGERAESLRMAASSCASDSAGAGPRRARPPLSSWQNLRESNGLG